LNFRKLLKTPSTKAYWWKEIPNFGDALAPYLLEHFAEIKVEWGTISHSKIVSIGSVLEHIPPLWDGYILGAGRLFENSRTNLVQMNSGVSANILALRGPLSARGIPGDYALGDPGVLANELVEPQEKQWDCGILPHWQDEELVPRFKKLMPPEQSVTVIDPRQDPLEVVRQISACHKIVTSSLHGVIVADACGVPRRIEICKAMAKDGGNFKFRDYHASIQMGLTFGKVLAPARVRVEDVKFAVFDAYIALRDAIKKG
jgi:pyruvyltransferase